MLPGQNSKIYRALLNLIEPVYPNVPLYPMKSAENREDGNYTMLERTAIVLLFDPLGKLIG